MSGAPDDAHRWALSRPPYAELDVGENRVALLKDGHQAYPAMLEAIEAARSTICVETYILRDDPLGRRFLDALAARAKAGVEVLLMYDDWGSRVGADAIHQLKDAGVRVLAFRPVRVRGRLGHALRYLSRRNHRKAMVVDGFVGFTGGLNLTVDYAAVEDGGKGWRDTHVRVVGPAARELERLFLATWRANKGAHWFDQARFERPHAPAPDGVQIIGNDFALNRKFIRREYEAAFRAARQRLLLTNAYFLPPRRLLALLLAAARRKVRVAVIVAGATDVKAVLYATRGLYPKLLRAGVEVYEWQGRVLHAKTAVADDSWATVGSSNLDAQSLRQNLEVNAVFRDAQVADTLSRLFAEDLPHCARITWDTVRGYGWLQRVLSALAFRLRGLL